MVLPNVTQLYFQGAISQDAMANQSKFEDELSKKIYDILENSTVTDLGAQLAKEDIVVDDDMILLEVGETFMKEKKAEKALILYKYYTKMFPNIVVAWNDMGDVWQMLNNKEEAIKCYRQALKIRPENPRAKESLDELINP
jgi:tetratricopeptide (TPR) repeat protein